MQHFFLCFDSLAMSEKVFNNYVFNQNDSVIFESINDELSGPSCYLGNFLPIR